MTDPITAALEDRIARLEKALSDVQQYEILDAGVMANAKNKQQ